MIINTESPDQPEVRALPARLDACCGAAGCPALLRREGHGEIKRMFMEKRL